MSLAMSAAEREAYLSEVHVGVLSVAADGGARYMESTKGVADTMVLVRVRPERWYTRDYRKQST